MKQRTLMKKTGAFLLAAVMAITAIPVFSIPVFAEESDTGIDKTKFATVDELKSFNTDDTSVGEDKNPARVYFGNNNQKWWIAGSQNGNVTLFAASPLATGQRFEPNWDTNKTYDSSWDCTYSNGDPADVYPNHYGASYIRNTTLKTLETNTEYFSESEQKLMNATIVHTNDEKYQDDKGEANQDDTALKKESVYYTKDKLYLPYGDYQTGNDKYITVGNNSLPDKISTVSDLNNGLRVDMDYWGYDGFWLRAPNYEFRNVALLASPGVSVGYINVGGDLALVPAFELNLSSVSFASAAPAASSGGDLDVQDVVNVKEDDIKKSGAFTLRYDADKYDKDLGSAEVSFDKSEVTLTGAKADTYLVVQNNNGAWAKQVTDQTTSVLASDMGLDSFANCKVWLETTDTTNRITYATLATEEQGTAVNITAGTGLTITSSNGQQEVAPNTAIINITVAVADGYYLPDGYTDTIQGLNGLTVTNVTKNGFTISGTPTSDVNITLPSAMLKAPQEAPRVTGGIGSTINGTTIAMEYAASEDSTIWTPCTDGSTETGAGTWYVRFKETDTQKVSPATEVIVTAPTYTISVDNSSLTFDTKNEGYSTDELSKSVQITNTGNSKVTLETPTSTSYNVTLSATELEPQETATLSVTPKGDLTAGTYNETIIINTTQGTSASIDVSFTVNGELNVSLSASKENIIEGESVTLTAAAQGGSGNYAYKWYVDGVEDTTLTGEKVSVSPSVTTTYKVVITDTIEDKSATATITVTAKKFDLEVPSDFTFDTKHEGYEDVSANSFSIKNIGNVDVTNINAALTGTNADSFTLETTGMQNTLTPGVSTSFAIKPNADLGAGTYTAQVRITGETGVSKSFGVSFTVEGHEYKEEWTNDETSHWHECECGAKADEDAHTFKWVVDKEATYTEKGLKHEECSVCGYEKAGVEIPVATPTNPEKPNTDKPNTGKPNKDKGSVETGDQTNAGLLASLFVMSALGIAVFTKKNRF